MKETFFTNEKGTYQFYIIPKDKVVKKVKKQTPEVEISYELLLNKNNLKK